MLRVVSRHPPGWMYSYDSGAKYYGLYEEHLTVLLDLLTMISSCLATMNRSIFRLKSKALDILKEEPNALDLRAPVKIVGDLHGQFFDLISMLDHCGAPGGGCR